MDLKCLNIFLKLSFYLTPHYNIKGQGLDVDSYALTSNLCLRVPLEIVFESVIYVNENNFGIENYLI